MVVVKEIVPIVKEIRVQVSGVNYVSELGKKCPVVDVWCWATSGEVEAICGESFSIGSFFCEESFGKRQFSEISRTCRIAVRDYKTKHPENEYRNS